MNWKNYYLCVFETKNHALALFTMLESSGHNYFQLVSTPCSLKVGCSYSIKIPHKNYLGLIKREVEAANLTIPKIYYVEKINGKTKYTDVGFS